MSELSAHEVLVRARNLIDRDGWIQGQPVRAGEGFCALGACNHVLGGRMSWVTLCDARVEAALEAAVGGCIVDFNDASDRTKQDVLAAFDRAIAATPPSPDFSSLGLELVS